MSLLKRGPAHAVTSAATTVLGTISLGAQYGKILGIEARNYASSAKLAAGIDSAEKIKLTDADSKVIYLDAADRDYKTALVTLLPMVDPTATGLTPIPVDATGAAITDGASGTLIAKSPVTVEVQDAGTATDYFEVYLFVEV